MLPPEPEIGGVCRGGDGRGGERISKFSENSTYMDIRWQQIQL